MYFKYGTETRSFKELRWTSKPQTTAIAGESLRGYLYENRGHSRRLYEVIVSADEIYTQDDLDFFEAFFIATDKEISFNGTNYISVFMAPGDFPVEFIDAIRSLPEVTLTLRSKQPGTTRATGETLL